MKKIVYLLTVFALVFASCNPMDDIYNEIDKQQAKNKAIGDISYTLVNDDYTNKLDKGGLGLKNTFFANLDDAKTKLPAFLTAKYPSLGVIYSKDGSIKKASAVNLTFSLSDPVKKNTYTVTSDDYTAIGLTSLNTSKEFNTFFDYKFPNTVKGSIIDLTYKTKPAITNYTLVNADYKLVGNGKYNNFDIRTGKPDQKEEVRRKKIEKILLNNFPSAKTGDKYKVKYATYNGSSGVAEMTLVLNKPTGVTYYTLTKEDYKLVGNGKYNNFDIRVGKAEEKIEARRVKIEKILLKNYPSAKKGDEFHITYATYDGSSGEKTMFLEFNGTTYDIITNPSLPGYGFYTYVLENATARFTYIKDWKAPFILMGADYIAMGEKYGNLAGRNSDQKIQSQRKIAIYLGMKYPYATKDDFMAVQYKSYLGGGKSETLNVNFVHNGTRWNAIPEVIPTTLQFGHNGKTWEPDNTIKYTLTKADYALVGNGRYNNFDVRKGKADEKEKVRLVKINTILLKNFPNDDEGQKYIISYDIYNGAAATWTMKVKKEKGKYVLN